MENFKKINLENTQLDSLESNSDVLSHKLLPTLTTPTMFFSNQETLDNKSKKVKHSAIDFSKGNVFNEKPKLISEIELIAVNFSKLIAGQYALTGCEDDEKSQLTIKLSAFEEITVIVDELPRFYQKIAQIILGDQISVVELVEFFIKQHYNWNQKGRFNETLMHYLISLPNSIQALNKFEPIQQENLIDNSFDRQGYSPLTALTQLYIHDLNNSELYKNLKASYDIIFDYDNCSQESTSDDSASASEIIIESALNIMIFNRDKALKANVPDIVKNYLEISALMCQHTTEPEANEHIIKECLEDYEASKSYLALFEQFCKNYEEMDQALLLNEKNVQLAENKM